MRLSQIITGFYKIGLPKPQAAILDYVALGMAHHNNLLGVARDRGMPEAVLRFHYEKFKEHFLLFNKIVHDHGDFTDAFDSRGRCDRRDFWVIGPRFLAWGEKHLRTDMLVLAAYDEEMFSDVGADLRFGFGKDHPADDILWDQDPSCIEDIYAVLSYGEISA